MATFNQINAFKEMLEIAGKNKDIKMGEIMKKVGYAEATAKNPKELTGSKGFQELLAQIDDKVILTRFYQILADTDKRSSLEAGDKLLKLKDRYPASKSNVNISGDIVKEFKDIMKGKESK